jgi:Tfp pilus assembly pilus retraction ATPase PilT
MSSKNAPAILVAGHSVVGKSTITANLIDHLNDRQVSHSGFFAS